MGERIIVIGASLSGIDALTRLVGALPINFPAPVFITQHVAAHSPGLLPHILSDASKLPAAHPKNVELIETGRIYVAPPDRHMLLEKGYVRLSHGPHENFARPAIDPLFRSAVRVLRRPGHRGGVEWPGQRRGGRACRYPERRRACRSRRPVRCCVSRHAAHRSLDRRASFRGSCRRDPRVAGPPFHRGGSSRGGRPRGSARR